VNQHLVSAHKNTMTSRRERILAMPGSSDQCCLGRCASRTCTRGDGLTRAFSGRLRRAIETDYTRAISSPEAPRPALCPAQASTAPMRQAAVVENDVQRMAAWAGQCAALARADPAADFVRLIWDEAKALLHERYSGSPRRGMSARSRVVIPAKLA
jgi:hypothetical protein